MNSVKFEVFVQESYEHEGENNGNPVIHDEFNREGKS